MLCNYKIIILSFITIAIDGEDFDAITDRQLMFSPGVRSLPVPINIKSDGDFGEIEEFSLILSVRDFDLQLTNTGTDINLRRRVCKDERIFSISSSDVQIDETVNIDLDRVFVSQSGNSISFSLAANESERISVSPAKTSVTILDNDSKLYISSNQCMI